MDTELDGRAAPGPGDGTPMVKAEAVHKRFGSLEVLKGIDMEVLPGQVVVLLGASGSGKSTFLRCINHLEKINAGRLWVDGQLVGYRQAGDKLYELREREISSKRAEIGMVFQRFNLCPHMTSLENICEAPCQVRKVSKDAARTRARQLLDQVGLVDKADVYANIVTSFKVWWITLFYVVSMIALGLHLYHGAWSSVRSIGASQPTRDPLHRTVALAVAAILWLGFTAVPIAVLAGLIG